MNRLFYLYFIVITTTLSFGQAEIIKVIYKDSLGNNVDKENSYTSKEYSLFGKDYAYKISHYKKLLLEKDIYTDDTLYIYQKAKIVDYHKNGVISEICHYEKNQIIDKINSWHDNGQSKEIYSYVQDKKTTSQIKLISHFWDKNNKQLVINGNGEYNHQDEKNDSYEIGEVKNFRKSGIWKLKTKEYTAQEKYDDGKLIIGTAMYSNGTTYEYKEIDTKPEPIKGMMHFYQYIGKKLKVNGDEYGKIFIRFFVNKNGEIIDIKILKGITPAINNSAIELLKEYGNWLPGTHRGKAKNIEFLLPITIKQQ
jgi:hypothetical protein